MMKGALRKTMRVADHGMGLYRWRVRVPAVAGGNLHRVDDLGIGAAAAEISGEIMADRLVVWIRVTLQQLGGHQQEARRAIAALERAGLDECFLHRTEPVAVGERLDGAHLGAVRECGKVEAT